MTAPRPSTTPPTGSAGATRRGTASNRGTPAQRTRSTNRDSSLTTNGDSAKDASDVDDADDGSGDQRNASPPGTALAPSRTELNRREDGAADPATDVESPFATTVTLRYDSIPPGLAESLRGIVNRYELRSGESLPNAIAVTSSVSGEGVTTASQALATLIAHEMGRFVCWMDCSWLATSAGTSTSGLPSLVDILADEGRILSAFQASPDLPQLMTLVTGPPPDSRRNMIVRSPEFERLLDILTEEFDHVLFDLPPVVSNANGLALLRQADASLVVARHRATRISQVRRTLEVTQPTPNIGVVLNRFAPRVPRAIQRMLGD